MSVGNFRNYKVTFQSRTIYLVSSKVNRRQGGRRGVLGAGANNIQLQFYSQIQGCLLFEQFHNQGWRTFAFLFHWSEIIFVSAFKFVKRGVPRDPGPQGTPQN